MFDEAEGMSTPRITCIVLQQPQTTAATQKYSKVTFKPTVRLILNDLTGYLILVEARPWQNNEEVSQGLL